MNAYQTNNKSTHYVASLPMTPPLRSLSLRNSLCGGRQFAVQNPKENTSQLSSSLRPRPQHIVIRRQHHIGNSTIIIGTQSVVWFALHVTYVRRRSRRLFACARADSTNTNTENDTTPTHTQTQAPCSPYVLLHKHSNTHAHISLGSVRCVRTSCRRLAAVGRFLCTKSIAPPHPARLLRPSRRSVSVLLLCARDQAAVCVSPPAPRDCVRVSVCLGRQRSLSTSVRACIFHIRPESRTCKYVERVSECVVVVSVCVYACV